MLFRSYLSGSKIKDKEGKPEFQILVSYCNAEEALDISSAAENASASVTSYGADGMYNNYYNSAYNWYL